MIVLDSYERRARLVPGLMLVAPVGVSILAVGLNRNPVVSVIAGSLTTIGAPFVLATFVRHKGLAVQSELWKSWGGKPTTQLLRGGSGRRGAQWRSAVEEVVGHELPAVDEEGREDEYDAAISVIVSRTRDVSRFKLLFEENRNYGYERNLLGLRNMGLLVSGGCLAAMAALVIILSITGSGSPRTELLVGTAVLLLLLLLWWFLPSRERTKTTAFKYAEQLLDAAVELAHGGR